MAVISQSDRREISQLIGDIVLTSQDAERCLKVVVPFIGNDNPSMAGQLERLEKFRRRMLGQLAKDLKKATTSSSPLFVEHIDWLVDSRNLVVHHFTETYGALILDGQTHQVIASLQTLLTGLVAFRSLAEEMALAVLEGLRDFTFKDTPEYGQIAVLCASFRRQIAS